MILHPGDGIKNKIPMQSPLPGKLPFLIQTDKKRGG